MLTPAEEIFKKHFKLATGMDPTDDIIYYMGYAISAIREGQQEAIKVTRAYDQEVIDNYYKSVTYPIKKKITL